MDSDLQGLFRQYIEGNIGIRDRLISNLQRNFSLSIGEASQRIITFLTSKIREQNTAALCCLVYEMTITNLSIDNIRDHCRANSQFSLPEIWDCIYDQPVGMTQNLVDKITKTFGLKDTGIHYGAVGSYEPANRYPPPFFRVIWADQPILPSEISNDRILMLEHHLGYYLKDLDDGEEKYHPPWYSLGENPSRIKLPVLNVCNVPLGPKSGVHGSNHTCRIRVSLDSDLTKIKNKLIELATRIHDDDDIDASGLDILTDIY